jgi:hypothetical protein
LKRPKRPLLYQNFQSRGVKQGATFETLCRQILGDYGFECLAKQRIKEVGIEIDVPAITSGGQEIWFNCKGSWYGNRPGLIRTDTLKKAITEGYLCKTGIKDCPPLVVLTSHLPTTGVASLWLEAIRKGDIFEDVICISDTSSMKRLERIAALKGRGQKKRQLKLG